MIGEFKKGDIVIGLRHTGEEWRVAKIVDWMPRGQQFQIRPWIWAKAKFGALERMPERNIVGSIRSDQIEYVALRLLAGRKVRDMAVSRANREMRRMALKALPMTPSSSSMTSIKP